VPVVNPKFGVGRAVAATVEFGIVQREKFSPITVPHFSENKRVLAVPSLFAMSSRESEVVTSLPGAGVAAQLGTVSRRTPSFAVNPLDPALPAYARIGEFIDDAGDEGQAKRLM
jgi:hypothetical protein